MPAALPGAGYTPTPPRQNQPSQLKKLESIHLKETRFTEGSLRKAMCLFTHKTANEETSIRVKTVAKNRKIINEAKMGGNPQ